MKINANITGTDALLNKFKDFGKEGERKFTQITAVSAEEIKSEAKTLVRKDTGKLSQSITSEPVDKMTYRIVTAEPYAPYVEFGTGGLVDVPNGWEDIAIRFKGKGIRQVNLPARPYMYPAFKTVSKQYVKDLDNQLEKLVIKYNKK